MTGSTVKRETIKNIAILFLLLFFNGIVYAKGISEAPKPPETPVGIPSDADVQERPVEIQVITELQDRYNALSAPAMIMLPTYSSSAIPSDLLLQLDKELLKQLVNMGKVKPVLMQKWLFTRFGNSKANHPFAFLNAINAEQYVVPVQYVGKSSVFKSEADYVYMLNVYPVTAYYPVTMIRIFSNVNELPAVLASCLDEMNIRLFQARLNITGKRVIIDKFKLDLLKLVELEDGEFEYISAPFIEHRGVSLRDGDDYFGGILAYVLASTDLFRVLRPAEFSDYANATASTTYVDYLIQGKVQISEKECVLYVDVQDVSSGRKVVSIKYPMLEYSLGNIWKAYREISCEIVKVIFDKNSFGIVPALSAPNRGFFFNNMFIGWNSVEYLVLAKGFHKISTGSYYRALDAETSGDIEAIGGNNQKTTTSRLTSVQSYGMADTYFVLLDTVDRIYTDRDGEHINNLLNK